MGSVLVRYRWRYFCPIKNKMITTKAAFEEQLMKAEHPDAVPVDGSRIETLLSDDPLENSTSAFLRNASLPDWK